MSYVRFETEGPGNGYCAGVCIEDALNRYVGVQIRSYKLVEASICYLVRAKRCAIDGVGTVNASNPIGM